MLSFSDGRRIDAEDDASEGSVEQEEPGPYEPGQFLEDDEEPTTASTLCAFKPTSSCVKGKCTPKQTNLIVQ